MAIVLIMAIGGALGYYFVKMPKSALPKRGAQIFSDTLQRATSSDSINLRVDMKAVTARRYSVISKAYFYSEPNEKSREGGYLTHWTKGELIPEQEKNDFVYVTFDNHKGRIIKGWLSKKDLKVAE